MIGSRKKWFVGGLALLAVACVGLAWTAAPDHHDEKETINVGTYQQEAAFHQYYRYQELLKLAQDLESEAIAAQQAGDQQRLFELQNRMQQRQNEVIESFLADIDRVLPDVAEAEDVQLVAIEIQYMAPNFESKDLTDAVLRHLNADAAPADDDQDE